MAKMKFAWYNIVRNTAFDRKKYDKGNSYRLLPGV